MSEEIDSNKPVSYAEQIRTVAVRRFNIVDEIDDEEAVRKFRQINPRHSEERSRIRHLDKGHLLVIQDAKYSRVTAMLRSIHKAEPGLKFKAIRNNGQIFVGHDVISEVTSEPRQNH